MCLVYIIKYIEAADCHLRLHNRGDCGGSIIYDKYLNKGEVDHDIAAYKNDAYTVKTTAAAKMLICGSGVGGQDCEFVLSPVGAGSNGPAWKDKCFLEPLNQGTFLLNQWG